MTLLVPTLLLWTLTSYVLAALLTPAVLLFGSPVVRNFYQTLPFSRAIWRQHGWRGGVLRAQFHYWLTFNAIRRYLTLPIRQETPSFFIVGFPKCGTTTLSNHLQKVPGVAGLDGLPFHETLRKESHFFLGSAGAHRAHQRWIYRSYFPTLLVRWVHLVLWRARAFLTFDATPLFAVLPHVSHGGPTIHLLRSEFLESDLEECY